uniref:Peptidase A2 domain-containing protein n=1 Tax=Scleropages formosus TaxID=113540 RepID=A0A8C9U637_SCLFO
MFQSRVPVPSVPASCSSVLVHRSCPVFRHVSGLQSYSRISVSLFTVVQTPCVFPGLVFPVSLPPSVLQYAQYTFNITLHVKSFYISSVFGRNSNARPCRTPVRTLQKNPPANMTSAEWRELADLTEANQEQLLVCTNAASRITDQLERLTRLLSRCGHGAEPTSSQTHYDWQTCLLDAPSGPRAEPAVALCDSEPAKARNLVSCAGLEEQCVRQGAIRLSNGRLTVEERRRRFLQRLCFYRGAADHVQVSCPVRPPRGSQRTDLLVSDVSLHTSLLTLPVTVSWGFQRQETKAMVDSGAAGNFMDRDIAASWGLPCALCSKPLAIKAIDGAPIGSGRVEQHTEPVTMQVGPLHKEQIWFYLIKSPDHPIILGYPWLLARDPIISWSEGKLLSWGKQCPKHLETSCNSTSIESPNTDLPLQIPREYADLVAVFSKHKAAELPPHRPWDCAIDLFSGTTAPRGRVYPLSQPEHQAMEAYITEALEAGLIRPSTSPASAGFFFVEKKDGGLRPCIDYRGLNAITVKYPHPLPLITSALEQVSGATIFTKLDLLERI